MTDKQQDESRCASDTFMQQWLEQQQQFWRQFTDSAAKAREHPESVDPQWHQQYWSELLREQHCQLHELADTLLQAMQRGQQAQPGPADNAQATASADPEHLAKVFIDHLQKVSRLETLDQCQLPPYLAEFIKQLQASAPGLDKLSLSRFPFLLQTLGQRQQHYQQQSQTLLQAWQDFIQAYQQYYVYESQLLQTCATAFTEQLQSRAAGADTQSVKAAATDIKQLADLFTLWAACYDREHQRQSKDRGYQHAYGELLNSSLALRQVTQGVTWPEDLRMLGLVPRQDYMELLQQHHQLRKDLRRMQHQHQHQLSELEQRISALEGPTRPGKRGQKQSTQQQSK